MTDGEKMVWAAEFVRALAGDVHSGVAAYMAGLAIESLRKPSTVDVLSIPRGGDSPALLGELRAMLNEMCGDKP